MTEPSIQVASSDSNPLRAPVFTWRGWPIVFVLAGLFAAFYPSLLAGMRQLQINLGDPRLVQYILEHSWLWVSGAEGHGSFWSPPVFHPQPMIGAYSDTMVGSSVVYWPFRALGIPTGQAYVLWMMSCLGLGFAFFYLFLRRSLGFGALAASVGALLYGFGSTRLGNFNSPQLFPIFYPALALLAAATALDPASSRRRVRLSIVVFGGALALQAWSAYYPAFFIVFLVGLASLVALVLPEPRTRLLGLLRREWVTLCVTAALAGAAVWPMARAHLDVANLVGWRGYDEVDAGIPTLASWFFMGRLNWLYGSLHELEAFQFGSPPSQHTNGVGFLTSALALVGAWRYRSRPVVRVVWLTLFVTILLTTRIGPISLWRPIYEVVPGARAIRFVARMGMYLPIAAGLGLAAFVDTRRNGLIAFALCLLCGAEQLHRLPVRDHQAYLELVERIAAEVDPEKDAFVLATMDRRPVEERPTTQVRYRITQVLGMWVSAQAHKPSLNGFYGNSPPEWHFWRADLRSRKERLRFEEHVSHWLDVHDIPQDRVQQILVPAQWAPWLLR